MEYTKINIPQFELKVNNLFRRNIKKTIRKFVNLWIEFSKNAIWSFNLYRCRVADSNRFHLFIISLRYFKFLCSPYNKINFLSMEIDDCVQIKLLFFYDLIFLFKCFMPLMVISMPATMLLEREWVVLWKLCRTMKLIEHIVWQRIEEHESFSSHPIGI